MTTLLVAGPRDWTTVQQEVMLWGALEKFSEHYGLHEVVHGGALGADWIASKFARTRPEIKEWVFHADWARKGRAAGPLRNKAMIEYVSGQVTEAGGANIFAMLCHVQDGVWTPGTGSTYRLLQAEAKITPVLVTHVTETEKWEEAL